MPRLINVLNLLFGLTLLLALPAPTLAADTIGVAATSSHHAPASDFDAVAATDEYMARLTGKAREKSDRYQEGGYWLQGWSLLQALAISALLLASGFSRGLRDFAERHTRNPNWQVMIYATGFICAVGLLSFPLAVYEEYFREHQYGLSNLSFADWLGESLIAFGVNLLLLSGAITGTYAIVRRLPRTWWAWGAAAAGVFMMLLIMISPVFIAPLFNKYTPLPEGEVRTEILSLARANGIPADDVYVFDASKQTKRISANVSGLFGTTRISLNDNLLTRTSLPEIRAVMAHEMGHYLLSHSFKMTLAMSALMLAGFLFLRHSWNWAHARWGARHGVRDIADPAGLPLLMALLAVFFFVATPVNNFLIRYAEVEADIFGLNASREPDGFSEAIFKLAEYRKLQPGTVEELIYYHHPSGYNRILMAQRWKAENLPIHRH